MRESSYFQYVVPPRNQFTILVSCDIDYFEQFFPAFVSSCNQSGNDVHLHLINPRSYTHQTVLELRSRTSNIHCSYSYELRPPPNDAVYYSCNRFLIAPEILRKTQQPILIVDVDSLVMRHIKPSQFPNDVSLFFREPLEGTVGWENEGTQIFAGAVAIAPTGLPFAEAVAQEILLAENEFWFLDQVALNIVYHRMKDRLSFGSLSQKIIDWEPGASSSAFIFAAKGPRKYDMQEYLDRKNKMERLLWPTAS